MEKKKNKERGKKEKEKEGEGAAISTVEFFLVDAEQISSFHHDKNTVSPSLIIDVYVSFII